MDDRRLAPMRPPTPASEPPPPAPPPSERRSGITPASLLIVLVVGYLLIQIQLVLVLVLLSLVFATVIQRPVDALERRHVPRPLAILIMYIALIGGITVLFLVVSPAVREQAVLFRTEAPQSLAELRAAWQGSGNTLLNGVGQQLLGRGIAFIENPSLGGGISVPQGAAVGLLTGIGGALIGLVTVLIISFYYLMEKAWLRQIVLRTTSPETRIRVSRTWDEVEQKVGDWLRGQLTLCLVIGATATVGYAVMGVNFWPLLGLWAGITEIVPILGPWLGGIPAVIIALTQGWQKALLVIGFIFALQMLENAVLVPRVMRGAVGLTPLAVFIAILAGTELAGVAGALLAIPVAAAIQVLLSQYTEARREARLAGLSALPGWRWMRGSVAPPGFAPGVTGPIGNGGHPAPTEIAISPPNRESQSPVPGSMADRER
ncbi:MAG: AI-2E family transporter [Chloroflexia bacterium]|nr:AI-2E family transporter [Chloroflexia bacterium]